MIRLGINIDHIATLRQQRLGMVPDPLTAARAALRGGADSITVHLREDRRHIQDADVRALARMRGVRLNLEMACADEIVRIACAVRPVSVCLVPEKRQELTTEGGLDVRGRQGGIARAVRRLHAAGIRVSLFIDPVVAQVRAARAVGADAVELHTGAYAAARPGSRNARQQLTALKSAAGVVRELGLALHAGHGIDSANVAAVARIPGMEELNIGFSIVARAVFVGLERAVREMRQCMRAHNRR